ncbi:MAG: hypothetical protein PHR06_15640 [Candidatus Cloacimonetes bacterium]|nr:hypothetical protein [Candidatus Cloacimonadota bacterium]
MNIDTQINELKLLLIDSLNETYHKDTHLYDNGLCERSKVFRIGLILSRKIMSNELYSGYSVDSEYNKRGSLDKIITGDYAQYPDLMLHKRGVNPDENLLVVEFKVQSTSFTKDGFDNDVKKLEYLTCDNEYNYKLGAHVFLCPSGYIIKWYKSGKPESGFNIFFDTEKSKLEESDLKVLKNKFLKEYDKKKSN